MIINKDNVTNYQVSHIGSTHEERLKVIKIIEKLIDIKVETAFTMEPVPDSFKRNLLLIFDYDSFMGTPRNGRIIVTPKEFIQMATTIIIPKDTKVYHPITVGQIYTYRTGTKYRVRYANSSKDSYTLETLSTGKIAPWCSDVTAAHIHSVFTLHTEAPSLAVKRIPIHSKAPEGVSSPVINGTSGVDPIIEKISMCTLSRVGTPIYFDEATSGIVTVHSAPRTIEIPTKGKTMPKTLKDNAVELVQENKAAAFTAAEIKAGQIINKQAISLIKPKLPMMVRGYTDSPVASVVLANVVALGLKQYASGNKKLEKISELMIAGAAFDSIDALNIDGIVNDFIAGLKLPAGVEIE